MAKRERFAARRKVCGYSQERLADLLKVDRSTVQRWERGEVEPQPWQRPKLATILRITSKELDALLIPDAYTAPQLPDGWLSPAAPAADDEFEALELARRVAASDGVGNP